MKAKRWAIIIASVLLSWFLAHVGYVFFDGTQNPDCTSDVAVVFGNKVNEDGTLSPRLKARLNAALELFQQGKTSNIIVSGGHGKEGFYEADKMKEYLVEQGVPDSLIIVDNKGDNTLKTAINTQAICKAKGYKSVTVVSQWFHITRTKQMLKGSGLVVDSAAPDYFEWRDFYAVTREFVAFYAYLL
jgi:vancomycin permeability regulator SanA